MSKDYRREVLKRLPEKMRGLCVLPDLDREYTLNEIAVITRAGPARMLGLSAKGHLGVGADADVTIYPVRPDHGFLFSYPRYVIKVGAVVVEDGDVKDVTEGREFIVQPEYDAQIEEYIRPLFEKVYTMSFANYPVEMERLRRPEIVRPA